MRLYCYSVLTVFLCDEKNFGFLSLLSILYVQSVTQNTLLERIQRKTINYFLTTLD